jgi:hypothetical protein
MSQKNIFGVRKKDSKQNVMKTEESEDRSAHLLTILELEIFRFCALLNSKKKLVTQNFEMQNDTIAVAKPKNWLQLETK